MKKILIFLFIVPFLNCYAQDYETFKDERNGQVYKTVKIFDQIWMAENLNVDKFQNGDRIRKVNSSREWIDACLQKEPVWMYFENNIDNGRKFGKIYNYYAIIDKRNLAPISFRIPSTSDFLDFSNLAVVDLKSVSGWHSLSFTKNVLVNVNKIDRNGIPFVDIDFVEREFIIGGSGNNKSGFNAFPCGRIGMNGKPEIFGKGVGFWTSTDGDMYNSQAVFSLAWDDKTIQITNTSFTQGFYLRCVSGKSQKVLESERIQKIKREKYITDSLNKERLKKELIAKQALDLKMAIEKRIKDSIDKIKDDSLRFNLKVLDVYKDAIVVKVDGQGHGLLISKLQYVIRDNSSWENTKSRMYNELTKNGWELPMKGSDEVDFFRKNYKNEEFRIKFKGNKTNEFFRLCMDSKNWDVMAFLVGEKPKEEDYSKLYFFGVKTY